MLEKTMIILGGGGHAKVVLDALNYSEDVSVRGIIDNNLPKGEKLYGIPVIGSDEELEKFYDEGIEWIFIGIGFITDSQEQQRRVEMLESIGFQFPMIMHPTAVVAEDVDIDEGTFVAPSVTINPGTRIGAHCIINTGVTIDHDCAIGDFVHLSPGVTLSGGVYVEDHSFIGVGSNVAHGVNIGSNVIVGAGSTVIKDILEPGTYVGSPVRKIK
ncbi:MAG: acetyltransferase [Candidatus Omnitrophica bacterium]|nr:acetyltransferase [Candidatus Omnitrophota bacterium]